MSKASTGVIFARILIAVIILCAISACIYFFVIKNDKANTQLFANYNNVLYSEKQITADTNLGGLESGNYYNYSISQENVNYKEVYLNYYLNKQILSSYSQMLVYVGNFSGKYVGEIQKQLNLYSDKLVTLVRSQELYETTKSEYGSWPTDEQKQAILNNFNVMLKDFNSLSLTMRDLAQNVFAYVTETYYNKVNPFNSLQYAFTYVLNEQAKAYNTALASDDGVSEDLYKDSLAMIKEFNENLNENFIAQTSDTNCQLMQKYFSSEKNKFNDFLASTNKGKFVSEVTDIDLKPKLQIVMTALGLQGRL